MQNTRNAAAKAALAEVVSAALTDEHDNAPPPVDPMAQLKRCIQTNTVSDLGVAELGKLLAACDDEKVVRDALSSLKAAEAQREAARGKRERNALHAVISALGFEGAGMGQQMARAVAKLPTAGARTQSAAIGQRLSFDIGKGLALVIMKLAGCIDFLDGPNVPLVLAQLMRHSAELREAALAESREGIDDGSLLRTLARAWHGNMVAGDKQSALSMLSVAVCIPGITETKLIKLFRSEEVRLKVGDTVCIADSHHYAGASGKQRRHWKKSYRKFDKKWAPNVGVIQSFEPDGFWAQARHHQLLLCLLCSG